LAIHINTMNNNKLEVYPGIKALIFDLDGTLADTMPVHYKAYQNILKDYNIDFTPELFMSMAGIPAVGTIQKINELFGTKMDAGKVGFLKEEEYEKMMHQMKPIQPVIELMKNYHGKLPIAVGTGGYQRLAWKTMKILELDKYTDILVSCEDVKHPKPHPETFLKCAERIGVKPQFCQVFEDGELGMQAAKAAGMKATLVTGFYEVTIGQNL
jgi:beta-phosphoglucomutase family hydrolase